MKTLKRLFTAILAMLLLPAMISCDGGRTDSSLTETPDTDPDDKPDTSSTDAPETDPPEPIVTVAARDGAIFSYTPEQYAPVHYEIKDGIYVCNYDAWDVTGCMTTMQIANHFSGDCAVNTDSVMIYSTDENLVKSWSDRDDIYNIDMMVAINRADMDYFEGHPEHYDDIQVNRSGSYLRHPAGVSYYMVPTADFTEYLWEKVEWSIRNFNPVSIAFEEPEMWSEAGHSESFKREWQAYFHEEWQRPTSSPEAMLKSMELKTYLFERLLVTLSERIHAIAPETKLYIAAHSTINYNEWDITAGLNHFLATGVVDGVIGQTWSDTARGDFVFEGGRKSDSFLKAYLEYASYIDSVEGTNFYALADPRSDDTSIGDAQNRSEYLNTVTASLLLPEIHRFEICPWVHRAFMAAPSTYRTIQQQCYNALNAVGGAPVTLEAGTPGIYYALSDTISWQKRYNWTNDTCDSVYGATMPLISRGIPLGIKALEQITSPDDLKGVQLLILGYDVMFPVREEINIAIADWVKQGGNLLLLSGCSEFWDTDARFWNADGSPIANLFRHLGITGVTLDTDIRTEEAFTLTSHGSLASIIPTAPFDKGVQRYTVSFEGITDPILSVEGRNIGFSRKIGEGHITAVGLTSNYFTTSKDAAALLRALVCDALQYSDVSYVESNIMISRRADIVALHTFDQSQVLPGRYIDIFDDMLSVLDDPTLSANTSRLLYEITDLDLTVPRFGFSGGEISTNDDGTPILEETAEFTTFSYTSASNSTVATRILAPKGMYPAEITAVSQGNDMHPVRIWDNSTSSLLLLIDGTPETTEVTVRWSSEPVADDPKSGITERQISVNSQENDAAYLIRNTAYANESLRFCDGESEIVYCFEIADMTDVSFALTVAQNYILEISGDGETWKLIADYSEGGTVPHIYDSANQTTIKIYPADHGIEENFYFRIRNCDTSQGWGGTLSRIVWRFRNK